MSQMKMSKDSSKAESRIGRWVKAPIRALIRARDFYVRSMNSCAGHVTYGGGVYGCPTTLVTTLPKSFSVKSTTSDEDFRELLKAASTTSLGDKIDLEFLRRQRSTGAAKVVPRSQSVAIGRIDEDYTCDFEDNRDIKLRKGDQYLFPRSKSYAVSLLQKDLVMGCCKTKF